MLKKVILIPGWIAERLHQVHLPISTVADLRELNKVISVNDIAGLVVLNRNDDILNAVYSNSRKNNVSFIWDTSDPFVNAGWDYFQWPELLFAIENPVTVTDVKERLSAVPMIAGAGQVAEFEIYDIDAKNLYVVLHEGKFAVDFSIEKAALSLRLVDAILKALYASTESYSNVAKTSFHQHYLFLLSLNDQKV
jgi:hypothetical protein